MHFVATFGCGSAALCLPWLHSDLARPSALVAAPGTGIVSGMLVRFTKGAVAADTDELTCVRTDGSATSGAMPRQGILPHAVFHFVVETTLEWHDAMFGRIARGATLDDVATELHGPRTTWSKITQAWQAESLVECLQAEQWSGTADPVTFAESLVATCRRHGVPPPDITPAEIDRVRAALREFGGAWRPLLPGRSLERCY